MKRLILWFFLACVPCLSGMFCLYLLHGVFFGPFILSPGEYFVVFCGLAVVFAQVFFQYVDKNLGTFASVEQLGPYAQLLWSNNVSEQEHGVNMLSSVLGARFGNPNMFSNKAFPRTVHLWKAWWLKNKDNLQWDPSLGVYLEKTIVENLGNAQQEGQVQDG